MIKEITVAGIKLNNYTALENLKRIAQNAEKHVLTVIEEVYMGTLLLAQEDETVKTVLEQTDVTVISEVDILKAVGESTVFRKHEIEKREFFFQFMKIMNHDRSAVYLLGDDENEVNQMLEYISEEFPRLQVIGITVLEDMNAGTEKVVNEINLMAPDMIISVLSSPLQENFLMQNKAMLLTKVWYGLGKGRITGQKHHLRYFLMKKIREHKLMRYVKKYKDKEVTVQPSTNHSADWCEENE